MQQCKYHKEHSEINLNILKVKRIFFKTEAIKGGFSGKHDGCIRMHRGLKHAGYYMFDQEVF